MKRIALSMATWLALCAPANAAPLTIAFGSGANEDASTAATRQGLRLAHALLDQANFNDALELARRVLQDCSSAPCSDRLTAEVEAFVGVLHAILHRPAEATRAFSSALGKDPAVKLDPSGHKRSIRRLFERARRRAQARLPHASKTPFDHSSTIQRHGLVHGDYRAGSDEPPRVRDLLFRWKEPGPSPQQASAAMSWLGQARKSYINARYAQTIVLAKRVLVVLPRNAQAWQLVGAAACYTNDARLVKVALRRLDDGQRQLLRTVCARNGISL